MGDGEMKRKLFVFMIRSLGKVGKLWWSKNIRNREIWKFWSCLYLKNCDKLFVGYSLILNDWISINFIFYNYDIV